MGPKWNCQSQGQKGIPPREESGLFKQGITVPPALQWHSWKLSRGLFSFSNQPYHVSQNVSHR